MATDSDVQLNLRSILTTALLLLASSSIAACSRSEGAMDEWMDMQVCAIETYNGLKGLQLKLSRFETNFFFFSLTDCFNE